MPHFFVFNNLSIRRHSKLTNRCPKGLEHRLLEQSQLLRLINFCIDFIIETNEAHREHEQESEEAADEGDQVVEARSKHLDQERKLLKDADEVHDLHEHEKHEDQLHDAVVVVVTGVLIVEDDPVCYEQGEAQRVKNVPALEVFQALRTHLRNFNQNH